MHLGILVFFFAALPVAQIGSPLAQPDPGTIFGPGRFHAAVRIPDVRDRLFIIGKWAMQDLRVTVVRAGTRTVLSGTQLPGARYGIELPPDAARADAVEIDGTAVNGSGGPILVAGTGLYARAGASWPAIALFGVFAGLGAIAGLIALAMRSATTAWFAALAATNAATALPVLGAVRPPANVNQPLHALVVALAIVATVGFARTFFGRDFMPRRALQAAIGVAVLQIVYVAGGDIWQDRWPSIPPPFDNVFYALLSLVLLAIAIRAMRAGRRDAIWYAVSLIASIVGFFGQALPSPVSVDIMANAVSIVALTCGLAFALRRREDERVLLERDVRFDALTALVNRRTFDATLLTEWSRGERAGTPLAAIMIDVDNFKAYNDAFGHVRGDEALRAVADALAKTVQRREDCVARYGGEEFVALLPGADTAVATELAEQIRGAVAALGMPSAAGPGPVTVSAGVAVLVPEPGTPPGSLIVLADQALYEAKGLGRNRVEACKPPREGRVSVPV